MSLVPRIDQSGWFGRRVEAEGGELGAFQRGLLPTLLRPGADLDVLYVVSATRFLEPGEAEQQPLAGALFAVHGTGARGLAEPYFAG